MWRSCLKRCRGLYIYNRAIGTLGPTACDFSSSCSFLLRTAEGQISKENWIAPWEDVNLKGKGAGSLMQGSSSRSTTMISKWENNRVNSWLRGDGTFSCFCEHFHTSLCWERCTADSWYCRVVSELFFFFLGRDTWATRTLESQKHLLLHTLAARIRRRDNLDSAFPIRNPTSLTKGQSTTWKQNYYTLADNDLFQKV